MISIASIKKCLVQYINSEAPQGRLLVVYVFGSFARNQERVKSDIDLAFLVDQASYRTDPFEATVPVHMIAGKMGMQLDRVVDVTILNSASLEMAYEIITTGRLLFESDVELRLQYEIKIKGMYFDFQPFLSELRVRKMAKLGPMMV
ncbi:MAG: nucleotidyltransferase domain-containing protein [Deltaproteobacteria bacterium]|jgi:predicted nucleotidyltransferase|nr:MAG: nucleotidyltransferase domain-containing protein [Deltaproteobacteria bacterium]